jgi:hypothetical protein
LGVEGALDAAFQQGESGMPCLTEGPPFSAMDSSSLELDLVLEAVRIPLLCRRQRLKMDLQSGFCT